MFSIVKIKSIHVYTAWNEHAKECWDAMKLLQDNGIPYTHMNYLDDEQMNKVIESLNTWTFSEDGENRFQKTFTKFPIVHWEAVNDNDDKYMNVAEGLEELQNSQLIQLKEKVVNKVV